MSMDIEAIKKDVTRRMEGAVDVLIKEFGGLRTGRANISLLEPLMVEAYGSEMPMNQVGTISVPEPRMLTVQVWDKGLVQAVEKAIMDSALGLNPGAWTSRNTKRPGKPIDGKRQGTNPHSTSYAMRTSDCAARTGNFAARRRAPQDADEPSHLVGRSDRYLSPCPRVHGCGRA